MKAIKRKFLVVEEKIRLNYMNYCQVNRYFDPSHFNLEDKLNLHFDYSEGLGSEQLRVKAVYIDTSKKMELYEAIEFVEEFKFPFPEGGITKKNKISVSFNLKDDTKLLWKIGIQITPKSNTLLHLSIS